MTISYNSFTSENISWLQPCNMVFVKVYFVQRHI